MGSPVAGPADRPLIFAREGPVARVTLNRPDVGNAIDLLMAQSLVDAAIQCDTDPDIRCVVLTGAGRMFCAGGDVGLFAASGERRAAVVGELAATLHTAVLQLARMRKPFLVLVNGPAAGAGLSLAMLGDVVLAARTAHFTAAYTTIGLTPDGGMSWQLPRLIGLRKAQEMILTNRRIAAGEAEEIGLVTRVVDDAALHEEGVAIATGFAHAATGALGAARALLLASSTVDLETQLGNEARAITSAADGPESREGIAAFLARRKPDFRRCKT